MLKGLSVTYTIFSSPSPYRYYSLIPFIDSQSRFYATGFTFSFLNLNDQIRIESLYRQLRVKQVSSASYQAWNGLRCHLPYSLPVMLPSLQSDRCPLTSVQHIRQGIMLSSSSSSQSRIGHPVGTRHSLQTLQIQLHL